MTAYVEKENLVSVVNKRQIQLNPIISNAILSTNDPNDVAILRQGSIQRDVLIDRVLSRCNAFHTILRNGETSEEASKPKAGVAPRVEIIIETRSGNKTATRIHGLEPFYVNAQLLADELKKVCAGSTSVEPWKAGKGLEVMVQGPQKDAVLRALEKRGILHQWVDIADKTKGKKK